MDVDNIGEFFFEFLQDFLSEDKNFKLILLNLVSSLLQNYSLSSKKKKKLHVLSFADFAHFLILSKIMWFYVEKCGYTFKFC